MKKERIGQLLDLIGIPVLIAVLGLILLFNPDSATALFAKVLGWILVIGGAGKAISMAGKPSGTKGLIGAAICIILGVVLLTRPLLIAEGGGRIVGILLVARGSNDLRKSSFQQAKVLAIVTMVVGAVLILTPLSLTRTLMRLAGVVVAVIGIVNIVEKLQEMKLLEAGSDSNIIDADE